MPPDRDVQRQRAAQVGALLRWYRESYQHEPGRRGLTQEQLLRRMAEVDSEYAERYSHTTVSRWESGQTRPTAQRLKVLGKALDLSAAEVAGLVLLAGLAPDYDRALAGLASTSADATADQEPDAFDWLEPDSSDDDPELEPSVPKPARVAAARFAVFRVLPLVFGVIVVGYGLGWLEWDNTWMPVAYVAIALGLVAGQCFLFHDRDAGLREFFWLSLFVLLTTPLLQFSPIRMDHYGFWAIESFFGTHVPYMFALLVNLALSASAGLGFHCLCKWQYDTSNAKGNTISRACWSVLPPVLVVYAVTFVFSNLSVWIQLAVLMPVLAALFTVIMILRDPSVRVSEGDRRFLLWALVVVTSVGGTLGVVTVLAIFVSPDLPSVLPDHNLFRSWETALANSGYTRAEALELLNLGYVWHAVCLFAYFVIVIGGSLFAHIYRSGGGALAARHVQSKNSAKQDRETLQAVPLWGQPGEGTSFSPENR